MPTNPGQDIASGRIHPETTFRGSRGLWRASPLLVAVLAVGLLALAGSSNSAVAQNAPVVSSFETEPPDPAGAPTSQILVKFKSNARVQAIAALNAAQGATQVDVIQKIDVRVLRIPNGQAADAVAKAYARNPLVQFAEPNALIKPEAMPNDPDFSYAWHLSKIQAPIAWDQAKATGVLIAVCDTGVAPVADLAPILRSDLGWNAVDGTTNWADVYGHGTEVAGTVAAATNNSLGVAGVAWGAQVIPIGIAERAATLRTFA